MDSATGLQHIPEDIAFHIFSQRNDTETLLSRKDLCALRLSCAHMQSLIDPHLFSRLSLDIRNPALERVDHQLGTMIKNTFGPKLHTKQLKINSNLQDHPDAVPLVSVLHRVVLAVRALTRLNTLDLTILENDIYCHILQAAFDVPTLEHLRITVEGSWRSECDLRFQGHANLRSLALMYANPLCYTWLSRSSVLSIRDALQNSPNLSSLSLGVPSMGFIDGKSACCQDVLSFAALAHSEGYDNGGGPQLVHLSLTNRSCILTASHVQSLSLRSLRSLDISRSTGSRDGLLWSSLATSRIELSALRVDGVIAETIEYLVSYEGLESLTVEPAILNALQDRQMEPELASKIFREVVPRHSRSLEDLEIVAPEPHPWPGAVHHHLGKLVRCVKLKTLRLPIHLDGRYDHDIVRDVLEMAWKLPMLSMLILCPARSPSLHPWSGLCWQSSAGTNTLMTGRGKELVAAYRVRCTPSFQVSRFQLQAFGSNHSLVKDEAGGFFFQAES